MIKKSGIVGSIIKVFTSNSDKKEDLEKKCNIANVIEKDNMCKGKAPEVQKIEGKN